MLKNIFLRTTTILFVLILSACSRPEFHLIDGSPVKLDDYQGKWKVINYWAEWCKPCLEEVPELNNFHETMKFFLSNC